MTYNFDPELWLENQQRALEHRHAQGQIDEEAMRQELEALELRYEALVARLDGTFTIPDRGG